VNRATKEASALHHVAPEKEGCRFRSHPARTDKLRLRRRCWVAADRAARLVANHGMIASFSRALVEDLRHSMSDTTFDAASFALVVMIAGRSLSPDQPARPARCARAPGCCKWRPLAEAEGRQTAWQ
jgi:hypothetical protein